MIKKMAMKFPCIGFVFIVIVGWSFPNHSLANNPRQDFLITLNGSKLTGTIKDISISNGKTQVLFENDFGNTYNVDPSTIFGFVCSDNGETVLFESKYLDGKWQFLKVKQKGGALSLYTSVERQLQFSSSGKSPIVVKEKNPQIWLQFAGEEPVKVYRLTYKAFLRKRMSAYPDLLKSIGKRGFRYRDLSKIVKLYNRLHLTKKI